MAETQSQALFLHKRLIENALSDDDRARLLAEAKRREEGSFEHSIAHVGAYEAAVAQLLDRALELDVAVATDDLQEGLLVTLTQDFYIRRDSDERGSLKGYLDSNRDIELQGRFTTARLIGATGQSETFGHKRLTMLAYVEGISLGDSHSRIELRPLFIGWRLLGNESTPTVDDRREVWPQQIDQFSAISDKRASAKDRAAVKSLSEEEVKVAFAEIIGEPFVPSDWGGETSDLFTNRLTMDGVPLSAAFAFKGPAHKGKLDIASMGVRGDQAIRLVSDPADLIVVQHHDSIVAAVRNLLSALARMHRRHFMVIDGESTATILREYGKLPTS